MRDGNISGTKKYTPLVSVITNDQKDRDRLQQEEQEPMLYPDQKLQQFPHTTNRKTKANKAHASPCDRTHDFGTSLIGCYLSNKEIILIYILQGNTRTLSYRT